MTKKDLIAHRSNQLKIGRLIEPWPSFAIAMIFRWRMTGLTFAKALELFTNRSNENKDGAQTFTCLEKEITFSFGGGWEVDSFQGKISELGIDRGLDVSISVFPLCSTHLSIFRRLKSLCISDGVSIANIEVCLDGDGVWGYLQNVEPNILIKILEGVKIFASKNLIDPSNAWGSCSRHFSITETDGGLVID